MSTAVIAIEGVLQRVDTPASFVSRVPQQASLAFYTALTRAYRVVLTSQESDGEKVRWWLQSQGLRDFAAILVPEIGFQGDAADLMSRQVRMLRAMPTDVGLAVVSDPHIAARLLQDGVPTALYTHPRFTRAEHRPEGWKGIRPWAEIEAEVDAQIAAGKKIERHIDTAEVVG